MNGDLLNDGTSAGGENWKSNWIASPAPVRDNIAVQNVLKFLVDGAVVIEAMDNRYLAGGQAGLFSDHAQISVRNFQAMAP